jgi:hypothetical protein
MVPDNLEHCGIKVCRAYRVMLLFAHHGEGARRHADIM